MPTVPTRFRQVGPTALPEARATTTGLGALAGLGEVPAAAGEMVDEFYKDERNRADRTNVMDRESVLRDWFNKRIQDAKKMRGRDVADHDVVGDFLEDYDKRIEEIRGSLNGPGQLDAFDAVARDLRVSGRSSLMQHVDNEFAIHELNTWNERDKRKAEQARIEWEDANRVENIITERIADLNDHPDRQRWTREEYETRRESVVSESYRDGIIIRLDSGRHADAVNYYRAHKKEMNSGDRHSVEKLLGIAAEDDESYALYRAGWEMMSTDPRTGEKRMPTERQFIDYVEDLDADPKIKDRVMSRLEDRRKREMISRVEVQGEIMSRALKGIAHLWDTGEIATARTPETFNIGYEEWDLLSDEQQAVLRQAMSGGRTTNELQSNLVASSYLTMDPRMLAISDPWQDWYNMIEKDWNKVMDAWRDAKAGRASPDRVGAMTEKDYVNNLLIQLGIDPTPKPSTKVNSNAYKGMVIRFLFDRALEVVPNQERTPKKLQEISSGIVQLALSDGVSYERLMGFVYSTSQMDAGSLQVAINELRKSLGREPRNAEIVDYHNARILNSTIESVARVRGAATGF